MLAKSEFIIILVIILVLIYSFQENEYFASSRFRLKIKGTSNLFLYNQQYEGFTTTTSFGAYFILGLNNYLISDTGYATKIYNNKCLYYKKVNPNNYKIDKNSSYSGSTTKCLEGSSYKDALVIYLEKSSTDSSTFVIYYIGSNNVKYYLSTNKYYSYYTFSPDVLKALQLEKV